MSEVIADVFVESQRLHQGNRGRPHILRAESQAQACYFTSAVK